MKRVERLVIGQTVVWQEINGMIVEELVRLPEFAWTTVEDLGYKKRQTAQLQDKIAAAYLLRQRKRDEQKRSPRTGEE